MRQEMEIRVRAFYTATGFQRVNARNDAIGGLAYERGKRTFIFFSINIYIILR